MVTNFSCGNNFKLMANLPKLSKRKNSAKNINLSFIQTDLLLRFYHFYIVICLFVFLSLNSWVSLPWVISMALFLSWCLLMFLKNTVFCLLPPPPFIIECSLFWVSSWLDSTYAFLGQNTARCPILSSVALTLITQSRWWSVWQMYSYCSHLAPDKQPEEVGKNLSVQETQVGSLSGENPLVKEMAIHSTILASEITWTRSLAGYNQSMGSQRAGHD